MFESPENTRSPLEAISYKRFGGRTYIQQANVVVDTANLKILQNNPNRVYWQISNLSAYDCRIRFTANLPSSWSIPIVANGGVASMSVEDDGEVVGYEVYATFVGNPANVYVVEVIRK